MVDENLGPSSDASSLGMSNVSNTRRKLAIKPLRYHVVLLAQWSI